MSDTMNDASRREAILREKQRRYHELELKSAKKGLDVEPHISAEMEDLRVEIESMQNKRNSPMSGDVLENLPVAPYTTFIKRPLKAASIKRSLQSNHAITLVYGLGGMGKTSLIHNIAREYLEECKQIGIEKATFSAFVWIKGDLLSKEGYLNEIFELIFSTINQGLYNATDPSHSPSTTLSPYEYSRIMKARFREVLSKRRTLLIVDGYVHSLHKQVLEWFNEMPHGSKAIIITREQVPELMFDYPEPIEGMTQEEIEQFIESINESEFALPIQKIKDLTIHAGNNPLVIRIVLGLFANGQFDIDVAINKLKKALPIHFTNQDKNQEVFNFLFLESWSRLDEVAQKVLAAATLFPDSFGESDIEKFTPSPEDASKALATLRRFALVTHQPVLIHSSGTTERRFAMHSLVRVFAVKKFHEDEEWKAQAENYWVEWAAQAAEGWNLKDPEAVREHGKRDEQAVYAAFQFSVDKYRHHYIVKIGDRIDHYYYICGLWEKKNIIGVKCIEAAKALDDHEQAAKFLAQHIQFLCRIRDLDSAMEYQNQLREEETFVVDSDILTQVHHAHAFVALSSGNVDEAHRILHDCRQQIQPSKKTLEVATRHWFAVCLYKQGKIASAKRWFQLAEETAKLPEVKYVRSIIFCHLYLAYIAIKEQDLRLASTYLDQAYKSALQIEEKRYIAMSHLGYAQYHFEAGDNVYASNSLREAEKMYYALKLFDEIERLNTLQVYIRGSHRSIDNMQILDPNFTSESLTAWMERIEAANERVLLLDYDGTLAPFKERRHEATPRAGVSEILGEIIAGGRTKIVIISGRMLREIPELLPLQPLPEIWGSHGWERQLADGTYQAPQFDEDTQTGLDSALAFLERVNLTEHIEQKPASIAVHWRGLSAEDAKTIHHTVMEGWQPIAQRWGFNIDLFDGGLELKVPGRNKGLAVRNIIANLSKDAVVAYLGDDKTDEDAFGVLKGRGLCVQVYDEQHKDTLVRNTAADIRLWSPTELLPFLARWR